MTDSTKIFRTAVKRNHDLLEHYQLTARVGIWLESTALKIYKSTWTTRVSENTPAPGEIFFSVWVDADDLVSGRANYNIHALKLRKLKDYALQSREFAEAFRAEFRNVESKWPHVSVDFGPQTLMQGWIPLEANNFDQALDGLIDQFVSLHGWIDRLLEERRRAKPARRAV